MTGREAIGGGIAVEVTAKKASGECVSRSNRFDDIDLVRRNPNDLSLTFGILEDLDRIDGAVLYHHGRDGPEQVCDLFGCRDPPEFLCLVKSDEDDLA